MGHHRGAHPHKANQGRTGEAQGPGRDERTRQALAEAAALVTYGRSPPGRHALARSIGGEPTLAQPWLRSLVTDLNAG